MHESKRELNRERGERVRERESEGERGRERWVASRATR